MKSDFYLNMILRLYKILLSVRDVLGIGLIEFFYFYNLSD